MMENAMSRIGPSLRPVILRPQTASVAGALDVGGAQAQPAVAVAAVAALDAAVAVAAPLIAAVLAPDAPPVAVALRVGALLMLLCVALATATGAYRSAILFRRRAQVGAILRAGAAAGGIVALAVGLFAPDGDLSVVWAGSTAVLFLGGLALGRLGVARAMATPPGRRFAPRTVIVGSGLSGARLVALLHQIDERSMRLVGTLDDDVQSLDDLRQGVPFLGPVGQIFALVRRGAVDQVVLALAWSEEERILELIEALADYPVHVRLAPDLISYHFPRRVRLDLHGHPVLHVADRPISGWAGVVKRTEDIVISSVALAVCAIPMAVIAVLIKLDSPGPVLFRQKRTGFNNHEFEMLKFRTMYDNQAEYAIRHQATRNDPRVTRFGALLRRSSLDELPQILNVLRGDMSIVGPRPHAPGTRAGNRPFEQIVERYAARHRVKPGLTGLAQVRGLRGETRTEETLIRRVESDLEYIDTWSLWLDIVIIARTAVIVTRMQNAY
jgi:Undecaprenyl-phosphate glucose phosphotransferase